jgi:hypothetical protein
MRVGLVAFLFERGRAVDEREGDRRWLTDGVALPDTVS